MCQENWVEFTKLRLTRKTFWKKLVKLFFFLAARITKSHRKGKKKLLKENRSRKGKIKPREKKT